MSRLINILPDELNSGQIKIENGKFMYGTRKKADSLYTYCGFSQKASGNLSTIYDFDGAHQR